MQRTEPSTGVRTNPHFMFILMQSERMMWTLLTNSTEETDGDRHKLKTYRMLLRTLGRMAKACGTCVKKRKREEDGESDRCGKLKSDLNDYDNYVNLLRQFR